MDRPKKPQYDFEDTFGREDNTPNNPSKPISPIKESLMGELCDICHCWTPNILKHLKSDHKDIWNKIFG
jgi:hypothetical protein